MGLPDGERPFHNGILAFLLNYNKKKDSCSTATIILRQTPYLAAAQAFHELLQCREIAGVRACGPELAGETLLSVMMLNTGIQLPHILRLHTIARVSRNTKTVMKPKAVQIGYSNHSRITFVV